MSGSKKRPTPEPGCKGSNRLEKKTRSSARKSPVQASASCLVTNTPTEVAHPRDTLPEPGRNGIDRLEKKARSSTPKSPVQSASFCTLLGYDHSNKLRIIAVHYWIKHDQKQQPSISQQR